MQDLNIEANTYKGYPIDELRAIFARICDPDDWKEPIACSCPGESVMPIVAAIEFYTATIPSVAVNVETMRYAITSPGYRAGPAGDH